MFAGRYFAARMFAPRYFPQVGAELPDVELAPVPHLFRARETAGVRRAEETAGVRRAVETAGIRRA
jgi:hypothetical protein